MVILCKRNLKCDGTNLVLLEGYGAYEIEITAPTFMPEALAWLERGGVYVRVGVRGGGEYGDEWHLAGQGTSAGGILIGNAIAERPDLFPAAIINGNMVAEGIGSLPAIFFTIRNHMNGGGIRSCHIH
jgi:prolyl oligopeptidase